MLTLRKIILLLSFLNTIDAQGIVITKYPDLKTQRDSTQIISWSSPVRLNKVSIDLYQHSTMRQRLGQTNVQLNNFQWEVSSDATIGSDYFIKITGISTINGTAWANTPTFSIVYSKTENTTGLFITLIILGAVIVSMIWVCCYKNNLQPPLHTHLVPCQSGYQSYSTNIPTATVANVANGPIPIVLTNPVSQSGYSGRSVAAAGAGGFLGGMMVDEMLHSNHHHTGNSNTDFGGGFFGGGGGGGDSSGGFC